MRSDAAAEGFTLVEVVVASVVLALVMASVAAIVGGTLLGARRVEIALDADLAVAEAEDLIADDLAFMCAMPGRASFRVDEGSAGDAVLTFWSAAGAKAAWGEVVTPIHSVSYHVAPMPDGGTGLLRREQPLVESLDAYYDDALLVIEGVEGFTVEAFDGSEWHAKWPAGETALSIPILVRAQVTLIGEGGSARTIYVEAAPHVEDLEELKSTTAAASDEGAREEAPSGEAPDEADEDGDTQ